MPSAVTYDFNQPLGPLLIRVVFIFHAEKIAAFAATRRRTLNKDQVSGKVEPAIGKVKQSVGETVCNEKLGNQGVADQAKGATKVHSTLAKQSMYDFLVASVRVTGWARTRIGQQQGRGMCDEGFRT
jgi:uncharacterized protein YjbJ (UPF0337 family)